MLELHELEQHIQKNIYSTKPGELQASFEKLQADVRAVKAELVGHKRMEEDKHKTVNESTFDDPVAMATLIKTRNVASLNAAPTM